MPSSCEPSGRTACSLHEGRDRLAELVFSRLIGEGGGERRFTRSVCVAIAGMSRALRTPPPEGDDRLPAHGWPDGRTALAHLGLDPGELDRLWLACLDRDELEPLLPAALAEAFFPQALWPWLTHIAAAGPSEAHALLVRFCRSEALRSAPRTRARPMPGTISAVTIDTVLAGGWRLFQGLSDARRRGVHDSRLESWERLPPRIAASDLGAVATPADRSAPSLETVRSALAELESALTTTRMSPSARRRALRDRVLLGVLVTTGSRIGALSRVLVRDVDFAHVYPDGSVGPALGLRPGKTLAPAHVRWKGLPEEVADWLARYLETLGTRSSGFLFPERGDPRAGKPMSPSSLTKILSGEAPRARRAVRPPLVPRPTSSGYGYSAHAFRHLAERLAFAVGRACVRRQGPESALTAQAYADALLDHEMRHDLLGYKDLASEPSRELLAREAAFGIWAIVRGDPARDEWERELERLRRARRELLEPEALAGSATAELVRVLVEHARLSAEIDDRTTPVADHLDS